MSENNWDRLVKNYGDHIGKEYIDDKGEIYVFIGLLYGNDDFYFALIQQGGEERGRLLRLSCVCALESYGYDRI